MQATIRSLTSSSLDFPKALRDIPSPPEALFLDGELPGEAPVAIVGSRRASAYGRRVATTLAAQLATAGVPIISGLAFGIDATAHRAALEAGGKTVAVLPGGLDEASVSPRTNLRLAETIRRQGALLSEYPVGTAARKEHFAARNRLISGLARAVVVIEAALPSGSLLTARHAIEQGREVWAVPGQIDNPIAAGTNHLIFDGAQPLVSVADFLGSLGLSTAAGRDPLLQAFAAPAHLDAVSAAGGFDPAVLESTVAKLELRGLLRHLGGRYYVRA